MALDTSSAYRTALRQKLQFTLGPNMHNGGTTGRVSKYLDTFSAETNMRLVPAQTYSADTRCESGGVWFQNSMTGFYKYAGLVDVQSGAQMAITNVAVITTMRNMKVFVVDRIWQGNSWLIASGAFSVPSLTIPRSFDPTQAMLFFGSHADTAAGPPGSMQLTYIDGFGATQTAAWRMNPAFNSPGLPGELHPATLPGGITRLVSWSSPISSNFQGYWVIVEPKLLAGPEGNLKGAMVPNPFKFLSNVRTSDCLDVILFKSDNSSFTPTPGSVVECLVEVSIK